MVTATNLRRVYKTYKKQEGVWNSLAGFWRRDHIEKVALDEVSLSIAPGEFVGLVGANGAGKTTLLKMLSGLISPSSGSAEVLGFNPWDRKPEYLRRISILLGQKNQLWWDIPAIDSFRLLTTIYDLDREKARRRVRELAEILDCGHVLETQLRRLSLGERMKMEIIGALLHEPEVLFLDEPTIGLDIVAQKKIRDFLSLYVKERRPTVILTSHYMDDIAKLASRLCLISKGRLVYDGTVGDFVKNAVEFKQIKVDYEEPLLESFVVDSEQTLQAGQFSFQVKIPARDLQTALASISSLGRIADLKIEEVDFEDVIHTFLAKESCVL